MTKERERVRGHGPSARHLALGRLLRARRATPLLKVRCGCDANCRVPTEAAVPPKPEPKSGSRLALRRSARNVAPAAAPPASPRVRTASAKAEASQGTSPGTDTGTGTPPSAPSAPSPPFAPFEPSMPARCAPAGGVIAAAAGEVAKATSLRLSRWLGFKV